jgi:hypothetical protein
MGQLIEIIIGIAVLAALGWGLFYVCDRSFPTFAPAKWAVGVLLIILILLFANRELNYTGSGGDVTRPFWERGR